MEFRYQGTSGVEDTEAAAEAAGLLEPYRKHMARVAEEGGYTKPECSLNLPSDRSMLNSVRDTLERKRPEKLKYLILVGIGGSNLGARAVYDSLYGYYDAADHARHPKMLFLDTNDKVFIQKVEQLIKKEVNDPDEIIVNIVSKSGGTVEVVANAEFIFKVLKEKFGENAALERIVVTTDVDSKLWVAAEEKEIDRLGVPELVGGRYSVFSSVGLFPLSAMGISIEKLLDGARVMRERCLQEASENPALQSAVVLYLNFGRGKTINDNFFFNPELESLGKWYRQLMGESIGKEKDREGNVVHTGMTPTVSIGSVDLHSVGQLYVGGPRDKITTFVLGTHAEVEPPRVGEGRLFPELVSIIDGRSAEDIISAIFEGTKTAYKSQGLPFTEVVLDGVNEKELGAFLQFKMMEMMYVGKLLNVDAFDQPNVELFKEETRKLLESQ